MYTLWIAPLSGSVSREWLAIAPNTATPTALPIERKNMLVPVTTPRSCQPTLVCAAISDGVADRPIPRPMTKHIAPTSITVDDGPSSSNNAEPTTTRAAPPRLHRRNPSRRYTFPACEAAIGQPIVRVANANPATTGPVPSTSWT